MLKDKWLTREALNNFDLPRETLILNFQILKIEMFKNCIDIKESQLITSISTLMWPVIYMILNVRLKQTMKKN